MLRYAFSTLPCDGWSAEKLADYYGKNGFTGIEIRESEFSPFRPGAGEEQEDLRKAAALFKEKGVCVTDIASGIVLAPDWEKDRLTAEYLASAALTRGLRSRAIRIFPGDFGPEGLPAAAAGLRLLCGLASVDGLEIWVETHGAAFSTGKAVRALLDEAGNPPGCRVIWDILHPVEYGETPEETLAAIGEKCAHVHLKDGLPPSAGEGPEWRHTRMGEGALRIADTVRMLLGAGYSGSFSLEWETKWRRELQVPGMEAEIVLPQYASYMRALSAELGQPAD